MGSFATGFACGVLLALVISVLADDIKVLVRREVARALEADGVPAVEIKKAKVVA